MLPFTRRYTQRRWIWARLKQLVKPKSQEELEAAELERVKKQERLKEELRRGYFWELGEVNRTKCKVSQLAPWGVEQVDRRQRLKGGVADESGSVRGHGTHQLFDADKELLPLEQSFPFPSFKADSLLGIEHAFETLLSVKNQVRGGGGSHSHGSTACFSLLSWMKHEGHRGGCVWRMVMQVALVGMCFRDAGFK